MTRGRIKRKTSPMHRIGFTHGEEAVPKIMRENTEQFFAAVTRRRSKTICLAKPTNANDFQTNFYTNKKEKAQTSISMIKPALPTIIPPPPPPPALVRTSSSSQQAKVITGASVCVRQPSVLPIIPSPSSSLELSTPLIESLTSSSPPSLSRQVRHIDPVDQDVFRRAYERAISVARSRLLFRDPYSLTRANATHGVLYSYYDHTPMCVFSHGNACNHRPDSSMKKKHERKLKGNYFRKQIFDDVVVENYIPYVKKKSDLNTIE